eukprot:TRINITY_DN12421_c0_g1_i1.p2 TRINITY_DN12421_c0_g1~~TRINITY_DN12421_c0_g1_i1.p2  ORF type:complete len:172 (-),score=43.31 TRINITY_DN12421_c0_g1_i1:214-729(-)
MGTFAEQMTAIVAGKRLEKGDRAKLGKSWARYEEKLLGRAIDSFKDRCRREAEAQRATLTQSFEVLTREVEGFPSHKLQDNAYIVDNWGNENINPESWYYATRGADHIFDPKQTILFADVLESMMPKFIQKVGNLGFTSCGREAGTWKVTVHWNPPREEERKEKKKKRRDR